MKKLLSLALIGMVISLFLVSCSDKPKADHLSHDHPSSEHPEK